MFNKYINDFLIYLETERGYSKNTKMAYENSLKKLMAFLLVEDIHSFSYVNHETCVSFIRFMQQSGLCQNSVRLNVEACRSFFKFLKRENVVSENPLLLIERSKTWSKIPDILTVEEIELIIESLHFDVEKELLYRSIIELLYGSGLRVSEVCNLRAIDIEGGMVKVRCAKGAKDRLVPCSRAFLNTVNEYWMTYRDPSPTDQDFVFVNVKTGLQLKRCDIELKIKRIVEKCKIKKNVSPHTFRHTFATHLIVNGADIRVVQEMLGHASITSTQIYINLDLSDIQRSFKKCHSRYNREVFY